MNKKQREYPVIWVFNEKHGDRFCKCNSEEGELNMFFDILKQRFSFSYYSWMKDYKSYESIQKPDFTKEDIEKLPDSMMQSKKEMYQKLKDYTLQEKETKDIRDTFSKISEAIKTKNKVLAKEMLYEMAEGEYENFKEAKFDTYE